MILFCIHSIGSNVTLKGYTISYVVKNWQEEPSIHSAVTPEINFKTSIKVWHHP